jgi:hypothetical protein
LLLLPRLFLPLFLLLLPHAFLLFACLLLPLFLLLLPNTFLLFPNLLLPLFLLLLSNAFLLFAHLLKLLRRLSPGACRGQGRPGDHQGYKSDCDECVVFHCILPLKVLNFSAFT